jgi:hypothetical protein
VSNWGKSMNSKLLGLAAGAVAALGLASAAQAAITIDISATGGPTVFTFAPGSYLVQWVGVADGGAYDAWNPSCPTCDCASGWRDVFRATDEVSPHPELSVFSIPGPTFSSALASLAAFKAAPTLINTTLTWNGAFYDATDNQYIPQPLVVYFNTPRTLTFTAGDNTRDDNYGGVSLRFSVVPEPSTWAMMILGFGAVGLTLRARRRIAA